MQQVTQISHINENALNYNDAINREVKNICKPLETMGIKTFGFSRYYLKKQKRIIIESNQKWMEQYCNIGGFQEDEDDFQKLNYIPSYGVSSVLWNGIPANDIMKKLHGMGIWNGISIFKKNRNSIDVYHFGADPFNTKINKLYIQHTKILFHFIYFFKEKASHLIDSQNIIMIPYKGDIWNTTVDKSTALEAKVRHFLRTTPIKKYHLNDLPITFSKREAECMSLVVTGRQIKEIGKECNISPRTVEDYITSARVKLQQQNKESLFSIFFEFYLSVLK